MHINARVNPQPKQEMPNRVLIRHRGRPQSFVKTERTAKRIIPAQIQRREYLFDFMFSLILHQRLSITISEAARQNGDKVNNRAYGTKSVGQEMQHAATNFAYIHSV